jgi:peptide/nickel transport system substrate-binding protein
MRGLGKPTGTMIAPMVNGWTKELGARAAKYDVEAAKKLLADAGYPQGFELTLDCPNDRYLNDEAICQAITAMWTRIGVKTKLQTNPMSIHSAKIQKFEVSAYMLGWGVATFDALYSLDSLISTVDPKGGAAGNFNCGRMSNPKVDGLIQQIKTEMDAKKRTRRHPRGTADREGRLQLPAPARPDPPLGHAQGRDHGAPRGRSSDGHLDHYQISNTPLYR